MKIRYVLKAVKNENKLINVSPGSYAYLYMPDAEDCLGWFPMRSMEHSSDLFSATFFKTEANAKAAAKEYGPKGVTYQLIEATVTGKVLERLGN